MLCVLAIFVSADSASLRAAPMMDAVQRTFQGKVYYQASGNAPSFGVAGVTINLIGQCCGGVDFSLGAAQSAPDGSFSITSTDAFTLHRLEMNTATVPKGFVPYSASTALPGQVWNGHTIVFPSAPAGTFSDNLFILRDAKPEYPDPSMGPYFLIIAPQNVIDNGALDDFVDFKKRAGFVVEVYSIEYAQQNFGGTLLQTRIRNLEINRLNVYGSRFKYVMLVGTAKSLPYPLMEAGAVDAPLCPYKPGWPTDWYYADLTSNYDSNGNGCLGDGLFGDRTLQQMNGYAADGGDLFHLTVAVGRIPFEMPSEVQNFLRRSTDFEKQSLRFKDRALLAMSMMDLRGWCWDKDQSKSILCPGLAGTDGAYLGEALRTYVLPPARFNVDRFYENQPTQVGSTPTGASGINSPQVDTDRNITLTLNAQTYGLVNLNGHGWMQGVVRTRWQGDLNNNNRLDEPDGPFSNPPNVNEVDQPNLFNRFSLASVPLRPVQGAVYVIAACSTGEAWQPNSLGALILNWGRGVAWAGGTGVLPYRGGWQQPFNGAMQTIDYDVTRHMLEDNWRLGEAVWRTMEDYMARVKAGQEGGWWAFNYDLFGDPTLSYWGNPGGESTLAAWPMLRQSGLGQSQTSLSGPGVPQQRWQYPAFARVLDAVPPSPIVGNNREVVVAHFNFVDVLLDGNLRQRLTLNQPAFGTPALAADGTIYALDRGGLLYGFPYDNESCAPTCGKNFNPPARTLRWTRDLTKRPLTSPIVGSDGHIILAREGDIPGTSNVMMITPDGYVRVDQPISSGDAVTAIAVGADRVMYATTTGGRLVRLDFYCSMQCVTDDNVTGFVNGTPPLLAYGAVYVGRTNGLLVKQDAKTLAIKKSFSADSAITAGPIAGPGGQVLIGTQNGTLYSFDANLSLRWQRSIGAAVTSVPAFAADALYIASGDYLTAYSPFSGATIWSAFLNSGANGGSAAVGYGREIYVQTRQGPIVAIGEGWVNPPPVLNALAINADIGGTLQSAVVLKWPPMNGSGNYGAQPSVISGYLLQRRGNNTFWQDVATLSAATNVYTDTNIVPSMNYFYRIQSLDAAGGQSSDFTITPNAVRSLPNLPPAPTLTTVTTLSSDSLALNWTMPISPEVTGFRIERSMSVAGLFTTAGIATGDTRIFTDTLLAPNTTYFYRMVALNDAGESTPSNLISGATRTRTLPTPQSVIARLLTPEGQIEVSWSGGSTGVSALVERNPLGLVGGEPLGSASAAGPFTYAEINPNSYAYRVKFVQGNNESDYGVTSLRLDFLGPRPKQVFLPLVQK